MVSVELHDVSVQYPLYNTASMQLRNRLLEIGTGGIISRNSQNTMTVQALQSVTFKLSAGDSLGLVGHNGAGKTTLLRTIAGIYRPDFGTIKVIGKISSILHMGAGVNPDLSGYENIVRMAMYLGASVKEAKSFIPDLEEFTELGDFLSMPVHTYSAGMLTRLVFGVATAVRPDILIVDEALGAGDINFQKKAQDRIENVIRSARILILASHAPDLINRFCNRVIHLEHGRIIDDRVI